MFFEDRSPYQYYQPSPLQYVLNVGWLDSTHVFPTAKSPTAFLAKLRAIVAGKYVNVDVHVNRMRGIHPCNLCGEESIPLENCHGRPYALGMSEIWIPAEGLWYASPSMVVHYIQAHLYLPPREFIVAVEQMSVSEPYNAQGVYDRLVGVDLG